MYSAACKRMLRKSLIVSIGELGLTLTMKTRSATQYVLLSLMGFVLGHGSEAAEFSAERAAAVKAAYLRYIAEYTIWPEADNSGEPIVIGVLGSDPNGVAALIRDKLDSPDGLRAQGRPLVLIDLALPRADGGDAIAVTELGRCDLLFLSEDGESYWAEVRSLIGGRAIMTVSEMGGFTTRRGMIEFVIDADAGRVRMRINLDAVKRADLSLSSRLLGLKEGVTIVRESGDIG